MYLIYLAFVFALLAINKEDRVVWISLCVLCVLLKLNVLITDNDIYRVLSRCTLITLFSFILLFGKSVLSCYQAFILFMFLVANVALAYDVANNQHLIIYNYFKDVVYGLVACQLAGGIPKVWNSFYNKLSNNFTSNKNKQMVDRI